MRRRTIGWALIAYGVIGVVLLVAGAITGMGAAARIERTAVVAGGTLSAAARATRAAADSFTSIDGSLAEAQSSADIAALAFYKSLFDEQLAPLAVEFSTSADQADQLAETLDSVSGSMSETRTDVAAIGVELDSLSDQLESLEITTDPTGGTPPLRLFIGLLLAWLAAPAIGAIVVGAVLLRTPRPVVVD